MLHRPHSAGGIAGAVAHSLTPVAGLSRRGSATGTAPVPGRDGRSYFPSMELKQRSGSRPTTSSQGPHRQLDQQATPELWGRLVAEVFKLPHTLEGRSQVSPASSRAVLFDDLQKVADPTTSLAPAPPLEPAHLHGVTDTSTHLCLPVDRARQVCALGWGEPHAYADHNTEVMIYGPRNAQELQVILGLIEESLNTARLANDA